MLRDHLASAALPEIREAALDLVGEVAEPDVDFARRPPPFARPLPDTSKPWLCPQMQSFLVDERLRGENHPEARGRSFGLRPTLSNAGAQSVDRTPVSMFSKNLFQMARMSCYIRHMARGQSGRLVLEVDPALKRQLHARVAAEGRTLKDWFLEQADRYLHAPVQQVLPLAEIVKNDYGKR